MSEGEQAVVEQPVDEAPPLIGQEADEDAQAPIQEQAQPDQSFPEGDPRNAIVALRREVQELRPQAKSAQAMQAELDELRAMKPYVEFVKTNWDKLTTQQQAQPAGPVAADPALEQYARRFDLYTSDGKPDVERAKAIREDNAQIAREEAQKIFEPMQTQGLAQQAAARLEHIGQQKDAVGRPLTQESIREAIAPLISGMSEKQRIEAMANPHVADLVLRQAKAIQIERMGITVAQPKPVPGDPLYVETAGGGSRIVLSETDKRLGSRAGLSEQQLRDRVAKFNPNAANILE